MNEGVNETETDQERIARQLDELAAIGREVLPTNPRDAMTFRDVENVNRQIRELQEIQATAALQDHPLLIALQSMNRKQRKAFAAVLERQNRKGRQSEGLKPCWDAARAAGWRGKEPPVRIVAPKSVEATLHTLAGDQVVTPKELAVAAAGGEPVQATITKRVEDLK